MPIFLSHAIAPADGPIASRLNAIAAAYGLEMILPPRPARGPKGRVGPDVAAMIMRSDVVLALVTRGGSNADRLGVFKEVFEAHKRSRPVIALVEKGAEFRKGLEGAYPVSFDRDSPAAHEEELADALSNAIIRQRARRRAERERTEKLKKALGRVHEARSYRHLHGMLP
ncbi:MAG: hypothetical protein QME96_16880 [Myxococcota bacterium]|nr:hypothetical protein [Myxococcota bacterium]